MKPDAPKRPGVLTSDRRIWCQNLLRRKLWNSEPVLEKQSFTFFGFSPDETSDNVAITKNGQKLPRVARDPAHPRSGALWSRVKFWNIYSAPSRLETYCWIQLWLNDPKKMTRESEAKEGCKQPSCSELNCAARALQKTAGLRLLWSAPIVDVEMNESLHDMLHKHLKRYRELHLAITFAHDRFCDP